MCGGVIFQTAASRPALTAPCGSPTRTPSDGSPLPARSVSTSSPAPTPGRTTSLPVRMEHCGSPIKQRMSPTPPSPAGPSGGSPPRVRSRSTPSPRAPLEPSPPESDGDLWSFNYLALGPSSVSIDRITTSGTVSAFTSPLIYGPAGLTAGPDGALWFANALQQLNRAESPPSGTVTAFTSPFGSPGHSTSPPVPTGPCGSRTATPSDASPPRAPSPDISTRALPTPGRSPPG